MQEVKDYPVENSKISQFNYPVKREIASDLENSEDHFETAKYASGKYPEILANFKIGNKIHTRKNGLEHKRDNMINKKIQTFLNKREAVYAATDNGKNILGEENSKLTSDSVDEIEENLRAVADDLGLTNDVTTKEKRDTLSKNNVASVTSLNNRISEDEDLESGINKIDLKKEDHINYRRKKESESSAEHSTIKSIAAGQKLKKEKVRSVDGKDAAIYVTTEKNTNAIKRAALKKVTVSNRNNEKSRLKREDKKQDETDIMKDLETSGELTVSGNKSPLAASSNDHELGSRETVDSSNKQKREETTNEKDIETRIQNKIDAIRDQVKRELDVLKKTQNKNLDARKKRNTAGNTLLDEENNSWNLNSEESLIPHKRSKRTSDEDIKEQESKNNLYGDKVLENRDANHLLESSFNTITEKNYDSRLDASSPLKNSIGKIYGNQEDINQPDSKLTEQKLDTRSVSNVQESSGNVENADAGNEMQNKEDLSKSNNNNNHEVESASSACPGRIKRNFDDFHGERLNKMRHRRNSIFKEKRPFNRINYLHRIKRSDDSSSNMQYLPFRSEDDEVDDEGDEFDDDGFDDRTDNLIRKRRSDYIQKLYVPLNKREVDYYDGFNDGDYEINDNIANDYFQNNNKLVKRDSLAQEYVDALNSDTDTSYDKYSYNDQNPYVRRKRQSFDDVAAIHGGGATEQHLAVAREKIQNTLNSGYRKKRKQNKFNKGELTDSDLFGSLPQSYEGELARFKRVKRMRSNKNSIN